MSTIGALAGEIVFALVETHGYDLDEATELLVTGGVELGNVWPSGRVSVCGEWSSDGHRNTTEERNNVVLELMAGAGLGLVAREVGAPNWTTVRALDPMV